MKDKKLQVFVSSTYLDLKEERQAAVEAILKAGHIPAGMELFTAGDKSQWEVIKRWIDESDVYMLLLGGRYGSVSPDTGKSYTHMEFDYAVEQGKARFSLVLNNDFIESKGKLNLTFIEREKFNEWTAFKRIVESNLVEFCEDLKDIKLGVINKLGDLSHDKVLIGWVRGDQAVDTNPYLAEMTRLSEENAKLRELTATKAEPLYNGLTYEALKRLLKEQKVNGLPGVDNCLSLFLQIGPIARIAQRMPFYNKLNYNQIVTAYQLLEIYKMITFDYGEGLISTATTEGHNFYLRALSEYEDLV